MYTINRLWYNLQAGHKLGFAGLALTILFFITLPFIAIDFADLVESTFGDYLGFLGLATLGGLEIDVLKLSYLETMVNSGQLYRVIRFIAESLQRLGDDVPIAYLWFMWLWVWLLRMNFVFFLLAYVAYFYRLLWQGAMPQATSPWLRKFDKWAPLGIGVAQFLAGLLFLLIFRQHAGSGLWLMWLSSGFWLGSAYLGWQQDSGIPRIYEPRRPPRAVRQRSTRTSSPKRSRPVHDYTSSPSWPSVLESRDPVESPGKLRVSERPLVSTEELLDHSMKYEPAQTSSLVQNNTDLSSDMPNDKTLDMQEIFAQESSKPRAWLQNLTGRRIELTSFEVTIGRTPDNMIRLEHPSVSKHHAKIIYQNGRYWLQDLQSTNGTEINGKRIRGDRVPLPNRAVIRFGLMEPVWFIMEEEA